MRLSDEPFCKMMDMVQFCKMCQDRVKERVKKRQPKGGLSIRKGLRNVKFDLKYRLSISYLLC